MDDLFNILNDGKAHVKVEMDAADLKAFSDELIRRAKDELGTMVEDAFQGGGKRVVRCMRCNFVALGQERHS